MITVTLRPRSSRSGIRQEPVTYYVSGLVNGWMTNRAHIWQPPVDMYELEDRLIVLVEIAGMDETGFSVSLDSHTLLISGQRIDPLSERKAFHQMEIRFGDFIAEVEIPSAVEVEKVEAEYKNGFLWVVMPKSQPRQIRVNEE